MTSDFRLVMLASLVQGLSSDRSAQSVFASRLKKWPNATASSAFRFKVGPHLMNQTDVNATSIVFMIERFHSLASLDNIGLLFSPVAVVSANNIHG